MHTAHICARWQKKTPKREQRAHNAVCVCVQFAILLLRSIYFCSLLLRFWSDFCVKINFRQLREVNSECILNITKCEIGCERFWRAIELNFEWYVVIVNSTGHEQSNYIKHGLCII